MKKAIAFVSAMLLAMSMTACGSGSSDNAGSQASTGSCGVGVSGVDRLCGVGVRQLRFGF